jgi:ribosomal protein S18 acetylase RimI-like enzyme
VITLTTARLDAAEIEQLEAICRSHSEFWRVSGDQDPDTMTRESIAAMLREDATAEGCETVVARDDGGRVAGFAQLLLRHPVDGCPWIGLLLVDGQLRGRGYGRAIVGAVEERFRGEGVPAIRLGVLVANTAAQPFWHALGYRRIDLRPDRAKGRPTIVMEKAFAGPTLDP